MVVITIGDIIGIILGSIIVISFILFFVISYITNIYKKKSKRWHNCFECKHYYLEDVAGAGDCCWYNCKIHNEYYKDQHSMNDRYMYRKCKDFTKTKNS